LLHLHRRMLQEQCLNKYESVEAADTPVTRSQLHYTRMICFQGSTNGTITAVMTSHWDAPAMSEEQGVLVN